MGMEKLLLKRTVVKKFGFEGSFKENIPAGKGKIFVEKISGEYLEQKGIFEGNKFIVNK